MGFKLLDKSISKFEIFSPCLWGNDQGCENDILIFTNMMDANLPSFVHLTKNHVRDHSTASVCGANTSTIPSNMTSGEKTSTLISTPDWIRHAQANDDDSFSEISLDADDMSISTVPMTVKSRRCLMRLKPRHLLHRLLLWLN